MNKMQVYDLIVIGGGPVGLSTAYHAAVRGLKTLVIEKFGYFNNLGSSAGYSRQFRLQYSQQYMSELSLSSLPFWQDLQQHSTEQLLGGQGSLWFGQKSLSGTQEGGIVDAEKTMDALGIPYNSLENAAAIEATASFENLPTEYYGFLQPDGGTINIKATEAALFNAGLATGLVTYQEWESVVDIASLADDTVQVTTQRSGEGDDTKSVYRCRKLAITSGAYINDTVSSLDVKVPILIWQMASAYFKKIDPSVVVPSWFVFQGPENAGDTETATNSLLYGFPEVEWANPGYIRVATDFPDYEIIYDPKDRHLAPSEESLQVASSWVEQFMPGLDPTPYFTTTCLIALCDQPLQGEEFQPEFFLDYMSDTVLNNKNIVIYTAGWAGKFIPILGDMICQMIVDENLTEFNYGNYIIARSNFAIKWQNL
jgi:sarcosine oxidase/L-pipecolate oxidase